jgi:hypothetical protein
MADITELKAFTGNAVNETAIITPEMILQIYKFKKKLMENEVVISGFVFSIIL